MILLPFQSLFRYLPGLIGVGLSKHHGDVIIDFPQSMYTMYLDKDCSWQSMIPVVGLSSGLVLRKVVLSSDAQILMPYLVMRMIWSAR